MDNSIQKPNTFRLLLPANLRLSKKEQKLYLEKYGIQIEHLSNGLALISSNREIPDTQRTEVKVRFQVGASNDPEGLDGLSHFTEHMVFNGCKYAPTFQDQVMKSEIGGYQLEGSTGRWSTNFELHASSGLTDESFGIIPGNHHLISMITEPLLIKESFEKERGVIFDEMKRVFSSLGYLNGREILSHVFSPDHPLQTHISGTEESLGLINIDKIKLHISKYYVPQNSIISILSEGDLAKHKEVVRRIKGDWLENFKATDIGLNNYYPGIEILSSFNHLNDTDKFRIKTKVRENRVLVSIAMTGNASPYTKEEVAFDMALKILEKEIFYTLRAKGFGYSTVFETISLPLSGVGILIVGMQVEKEVYPRLLKEIKSLFATGIKRIINQGLCVQVVERERLRQLDTPISLSARLSHIIVGLRDYGQIVRADDFRKMSLSVTSRDVKNILKMFLETPKGLFVCGDY